VTIELPLSALVMRALLVGNFHLMLIIMSFPIKKYLFCIGCFGVDYIIVRYFELLGILHKLVGNWEMAVSVWSAKVLIQPFPLYPRLYLSLY
jgi:hypothetical protein